MKFKPISLDSANKFINQHHRHMGRSHRWKFGVSIVDDDDKIIGVAIASRPVSRVLDDGYTLEITRVCTTGEIKNLVSQLISRICTIAKAFGYTKVITYTRIDENGSSLKASNFTSQENSMIIRKRSWDTPSRHREDKTEIIPRIRWERHL